MNLSANSVKTIRKLEAVACSAEEVPPVSNADRQASHSICIYDQIDFRLVSYIGFKVTGGQALNPISTRNQLVMSERDVTGQIQGTLEQQVGGNRADLLIELNASGCVLSSAFTVLEDHDRMPDK